MHVFLVDIYHCAVCYVVSIVIYVHVSCVAVFSYPYFTDALFSVLQHHHDQSTPAPIHYLIHQLLLKFTSVDVLKWQPTTPLFSSPFVQTPRMSPNFTSLAPTITTSAQPTPREKKDGESPTATTTETAPASTLTSTSGASPTSTSTPAAEVTPSAIASDVNVALSPVISVTAPDTIASSPSATAASPSSSAVSPSSSPLIIPNVHAAIPSPVVSALDDILHDDELIDIDNYDPEEEARSAVTKMKQQTPMIGKKKVSIPIPITSLSLPSPKIEGVHVTTAKPVATTSTTSTTSEESKSTTPSTTATPRSPHTTTPTIAAAPAPQVLHKPTPPAMLLNRVATPHDDGCTCSSPSHDITHCTSWRIATFRILIRTIQSQSENQDILIRTCDMLYHYLNDTNDDDQEIRRFAIEYGCVDAMFVLLLSYFNNTKLCQPALQMLCLLIGTSTQRSTSTSTSTSSSPTPSPPASPRTLISTYHTQLIHYIMLTKKSSIDQLITILRRHETSMLIVTYTLHLLYFLCCGELIPVHGIQTKKTKTDVYISPTILRLMFAQHGVDLLISIISRYPKDYTIQYGCIHLLSHMASIDTTHRTYVISHCLGILRTTVARIYVDDVSIQSIVLHMILQYNEMEQKDEKQQTKQKETRRTSYGYNNNRENHTSYATWSPSVCKETMEDVINVMKRFKTNGKLRCVCVYENVHMCVLSMICVWLVRGKLLGHVLL